MPRFRRISLRHPWRRLALHTWARPADPSVHGLLDVDATAALAYLDELREATSTHVTVTHLVGAAAARALAERPEVNAIVRPGRGIWQREAIDVYFQVSRDSGEDLAGARVERCDEKHPVEIARELAHLSAKVRAHLDPTVERAHGTFGKLPDFLIGPLMRISDVLSYDLGLDLSRLGVPFDAFGSIMVSNIGVFGLHRALAPLVPWSHTPLLLTVGRIEKGPIVIEDRVVARPVLPLGVTFDHRLMDGAQAGVLARRMLTILEDPRRELGIPEGPRHAREDRSPRPKPGLFEDLG